MNDLITAIGLLFFIEGFFIAIFPSRIKSMLEIIKNTPENRLRGFGITFLIIVRRSKQNLLKTYACAQNSKHFRNSPITFGFDWY